MLGKPLCEVSMVRHAVLHLIPFLLSHEYGSPTVFRAILVLSRVHLLWIAHGLYFISLTRFLLLVQDIFHALHHGQSDMYVFLKILFIHF